MSDQSKTAAKTERPDSEHLPDLAPVVDDAVKGGLNFSKITYNVTPAAG